MKKKTIARTAVIVLAVAAVSVFGMFAAENSPQETEAANTVVAASAEKEEKQEKKDRAEGEDETADISAKEPGQEKRAEAGGSQQAEPNSEKQKTTAPAGQSTASGKSEREDNTAQGNGGTGKAEAGETKPAHTHEWQEVYGERTVYKTEQKFYAVICNQCSLDMSAYSEEEIWDHLFSGACSSFSTDVYRDVTVEKSEQYICGYKCGCGAEKQ